MFTNKRGCATRHKEKIVRVGTYQKMLFQITDLIKPRHVIEHGMGKVSTPLFHELSSVERITSFENDLNWQTCETCKNYHNDKTHKISKFIQDEKELLLYMSIDKPSETIALIDGPHLERCSLIPLL
jgi:hypothetical protein